MIIPGGVANLADNSFGYRLERERINLLYEQNYSGVFATLLYAVPWVYVSWGHDSHQFLTWFLAVMVGITAIRWYASFSWFRRKKFITSAKELQNWLRLLQFLLFATGAAWAMATSRFGLLTSETQKTFLVVIIIFMCGGAIVCFSASFLATALVVSTASVPWVASMLYYSRDRFETVTAVVAFIYAMLALVVAYRLNKYIKQSLRLAIENEMAREALAESDHRLRVSLESSRATAWSWDPQVQILTCESALYRDPLREALAEASADQMEIDLDHHYKANGRDLWLAVRGQAQKDGKGNVFLWKGVCWDVTDRKAQEELRKDRDIHEAANKAKSVFLANVSHEIRTPLTAIVGSTQILLNSVTNETMRKDLQMTLKNATYLTALVNDLLDLSKIETGRLYVQKSMTAIRQEIREVVLSLNESIRAKAVEMNVDYLTEVPDFLETDPVRFRQVLINLIANAVKFSAGGKIDVKIAYQETNDGRAQLKINVADNGIGMDEKAQSQLFQAFSRGNGALLHKVPGSGLGLAISKNLARLMGGDLRLVWSQPGRGSEFEWTLETRAGGQPLVPAPRAAQPFANREQSPRARPLDGVRILIAEDSIDILELMVRFLEIKGAVIDGVENGHLALERAMTGAYDVVLMDINMPIMDGYQATAELRRRGFGRPIIALTAHASMDDRQLCLTAGCNAYISKPVDIEHLVRTIREQINSAAPYSQSDNVVSLT